MRIYITGCAKSGTSLMWRLFRYFEGVELASAMDAEWRMSGEIELGQFLGFGEGYVGKRDRKTIFSDELGGEELDRQAGMLEGSGVRVVNMVRDFRDVCLSDGGYVSEGRWLACMEQREVYGGLISAEVRYEDLVRDGDVVQGYLGDRLGLRVGRRFSEYPVGWYGERPIDMRSVGKDWSGVEVNERVRGYLMGLGYA